MRKLKEGCDLNPIQFSYGHCGMYRKSQQFFCSGFCEIKYHLEMHSYGIVCPPPPDLSKLIWTSPLRLCEHGILFRMGPKATSKTISTLTTRGEGVRIHFAHFINGTLFRRNRTLKNVMLSGSIGIHQLPNPCLSELLVATISSLFMVIVSRRQAQSPTSSRGPTKNKLQAL